MPRCRKYIVKTRNMLAIAALALVATLGLAGCTTTSQDTAQSQAVKNANDRQNYIPKNDVEGKNYNARQKLADDPNTILWCSVYPANPNVKPYTVPIVGKLTSSNKRPYATTQSYAGSNDGYYSPELPGSDGMYGASSEYRYGFDPAGNYWDFTAMETVCSSIPTIIQKNTTNFAISADGDINTLSARANAALRSCNNNDPSKPCAAAAQVLGIPTEGK
jgi:hypothetical protein